LPYSKALQMSEKAIFRKEIAYFMRRLYKRHLTSSSGGNISMRIGPDEILITPSQTDKARIKTKDIITLRLDGTYEKQNLSPSMESSIHLEIYKLRPDIQVIVHAHPVTATSFTVVHKPIRCDLTGESSALLGKPMLAAYALMGTEKLAMNVANSLINTNVVLMENHGIITVGRTLFEAFDRMEALENCARINVISGIIGKAIPLNAKQLYAIDKLIGL